MLWVEILVWSAIVLIVVTFLARIFFWQHILDAEDKFFAWLGVSPGVHEILKSVAAILGLGYLFSRYGPFRRRT
jgi:hypothetical protein